MSKPKTHVLGADGQPVCGHWVKPGRLKNTGTHRLLNRVPKSGDKPTCQRCLKKLGE